MSGNGCFELLKFGECWKTIHKKYIPVGRIKSVRIHKNPMDFMNNGQICKMLSRKNNRYKNGIHKCSVDIDFNICLRVMVQTLYGDDEKICTCDAAVAIYTNPDEVGEDEYDKFYETLFTKGCKCDLPLVFPLYEVSVYCHQNKDSRRYMLAPGEREHMDRFLAGTDNPLYDLVHELRYNPRIGLGMEKEEARTDFEGETSKKRAKVG